MSAPTGCRTNPAVATTIGQEWMQGGAALLAEAGEDAGPQHVIMAAVAELLAKHGPLAVVECLRDAADYGRDCLAEAASDSTSTQQLRERAGANDLHEVSRYLTRAAEVLRGLP